MALEDACIKYYFCFQMSHIYLGGGTSTSNMVDASGIVCAQRVFLHRPIKVAVSHFLVLVTYPRLFNLPKISRPDKPELFLFLFLVNQRLHFLSFSRMSLEAELVNVFYLFEKLV